MVNKVLKSVMKEPTRQSRDRPDTGLIYVFHLTA